MSSKFNGFSQEEIKKLSKSGGTGNEGPNAKVAVFAKAGRGLLRVGAETEIKSKAQSKSTIKVPAVVIPKTNNSTNESTLEDVNLEESMSTSLEEALFYKPRSKSRKTISEEVPVAEEKKLKDLNDSSILSDPRLDESSPYKGISLKDFESHRKIIQEQNKQKKEMLYKAIEHHSQKTAAEAKKIENIKFELTKLDNELATDVSILRKQIENACINYTNIEKQYSRIEAQFLRAKLDLHNASEKKELLTEHLCTVIAHNEDRKATKLTELMEKVGISPTGELNGSSNCSIYDVNDSNISIDK